MKPPSFRPPTFVGGLKPIKWKPQFGPPLRLRPRISDGAYGCVNGDLLFFIFQTRDPYYKGWRSWDKSGSVAYTGNETIRYRKHWNVWLYFGSGEGTLVGCALKTRLQAKRAARRALLQKLGDLLL